MSLTHLDAQGNPSMVDISAKAVTKPKMAAVIQRCRLFAPRCAEADAVGAE